ncbi:MAG: GDSL-type esterase/lipase family protein [Deltaproteobacteria bacterium]|jgi:lysophospholipase L1-like esterase|nr:GDSL-type esterase/lipase family protein [Deltaproteobacteria bacterium]
MSKKTIALLGDSLTEGHRWTDLDKGVEAINFGLSGDTTMGVYFRLGLVAQTNPDLIFLQVGINDLSQGREPQELVRLHRRLWRGIAERAPKAKLVVCSLVPIRESKLPWVGIPLTTAKVRRTNELMARAIKSIEVPRVTFLDLYAPMADPEQELPDDFTDDGVHLTKKAYRVWRNELKTFLKTFEY